MHTNVKDYCNSCLLVIPGETWRTKKDFFLNFSLSPHINKYDKLEIYDFYQL